MHAEENPLKLLRNFVNEVEQFVDQAAKHFGADHLGGPQGFVIMHLIKHAQEDISFKDIEMEFHLSKSVTSNLIKRMEKNGFVRIECSSKDKRVKFVRLTDFGREKAENLKAFLDYLHQVLTTDISKEDFETTERVMRQLADNIRVEKEKGANNTKTI